MSPAAPSPLPRSRSRVPFPLALVATVFAVAALDDLLAARVAPRGTLAYAAVEALVFGVGMTLLWAAYPAEPRWLRTRQDRYGRVAVALVAGLLVSGAILALDRLFHTLR